MASEQLFIVVISFAALVDDIVARGWAARLQCEEWRNWESRHESQQLVVVSADPAIQGEFCTMPKDWNLVDNWPMSFSTSVMLQ
jgi:hypothetical protein